MPSETLSIDPGATETTSELLQVGGRERAALRLEGDVELVDAVEPLVSFTNEEALGPIETAPIELPETSNGRAYSRFEISGLSLVGFDVTAISDAPEPVEVALQWVAQ